MITSLLADEAKLNITIDDNRLRTNLPKENINTILGFNQSPLRSLVDYAGFIRSIPGL